MWLLLELWGGCGAVAPCPCAVCVRTYGAGASAGASAGAAPPPLSLFFSLPFQDNGFRAIDRHESIRQSRKERREGKEHKKGGKGERDSERDQLAPWLLLWLPRTNPAASVMWNHTNEKGKSATKPPHLIHTHSKAQPTERAHGAHPQQPHHACHPAAASQRSTNQQR
ncbi:hypothetical protein IWX49DRAFT_639984 [Phyllosticta citricarpa]